MYNLSREVSWTDKHERFKTTIVKAGRKKVSHEKSAEAIVDIDIEGQKG